MIGRDITTRHDCRAPHDRAPHDRAPHDRAPHDCRTRPDYPARLDRRLESGTRPARTAPPPACDAPPPPVTHALDRFVDDQLFEEDVRAVVALMRPHRRERLMGWAEYRTGGANFRATISWEKSFEHAPQTAEERWLAVPRLTDVLESILVGSVKDQDELTPEEEFDIYRGVLRELYRRLDEMQGRYE